MSEELLHPDEALRLVVESGASAFRAAGAGALETLSLREALGRALPSAILATVDQPPFDKSAMDGYATTAGRPGERLPGPWRVVGTLAAGAAPSLIPGPGEALRVMTGAPLPAGTSFVQRVEYTAGAGDHDDLVLFTEVETGSNIIRRGENLRAGALLLGPRVLGPGDLGILASSGFATVEVARRPRLGVISTGDELVLPGEALGPASIYDSNGPQLLAQAATAGAVAKSYGLVRDDEAALSEAISAALDECEVLLLSGGVSMGDFDHVPRVLRRLGVRRVFHKIAMRPGKPTWFGERGRSVVFGLPGNPVSTFVNFEVLIRPYLAARTGLEHRPTSLFLPLGEEISRRGADRLEFLPARIAHDGRASAVYPLRYHGSSMLNVLAEAEVLIRLELGVERVGKGELVHARLLRS